ncbi:MAG: hypothetical protein ACI4ML_03795, partial [Aristaeellaceae bacterium]
MKQEEFRRLLAAGTPDMPDSFRLRVDAFLADRVAQEAHTPTRQPVRVGGRIGVRALAFALLAALLLGSVAFAAVHFGIFDSLRFMVGAQPDSTRVAAQQNLHQETINNVEITIREAAYDGRTLFLQYSYRMLDVDKPLGNTDEYGQLREGLTGDMWEQLYDHNVGWWIDHFWVNGQCMDMADNSGAVESGTNTPGEILRTEYWRLDNLGVTLSGQVEIALPIGECQPLEDYRLATHPEKYGEDGNLLKPDKGLVTFSFDAGNMLSQVVTLHPNVETVTPEVTAKVSEASFTPLMTYITLDLVGNPDALAAYKAEHGEGYFDEDGNLLWPYESLDVHSGYIA